MQTDSVHDTVSEITTLDITNIHTRPPHTTAILTDPVHFKRVYKINPHMNGEVNVERAKEQWTTLYETFIEHAETVHTLDPNATTKLTESTTAPSASTLPDMVFVANHGLPTPDGTGFISARMATEQRAGEPLHFGAWADEHDYDIFDAPEQSFEGMGDAIWHPNRELLWGGHGVRTERCVYDDISTRLNVPVIPLELTSEHFYHLDVSFAPVSESVVLIYPEAFTETGLAKIRAVFDTVLEAPEQEALSNLAVNIEVFGETVIIPSGTPETQRLLQDAGFDVVPVDTSEFQKAGGSVCCLTLRCRS